MISNIIQHTGNDNTLTYQVEVIVFIWPQIPVTNLQGNVQQLEGRINNQILGINPLTPMCDQDRISPHHLNQYNIKQTSDIS